MKSNLAKDLLLMGGAVIAFFIGSSIGRDAPAVSESIPVERNVAKERRALGSAISTSRERRAKLFVSRSDDELVDPEVEGLEARADQVVFVGDLVELIAVDPDSAAEVAAYLSESGGIGGAPEHLLKKVYQGYCVQDQLAAWEWRDSLSEGKAEKLSEGRVADFFSWSGRDRAVAVEWMVGQAASPERDEMATVMVLASAIQEPETALRMAELIEDDEKRSKAQQLIAEGGHVSSHRVEGGRVEYTLFSDVE